MSSNSTKHYNDAMNKNVSDPVNIPSAAEAVAKMGLSQLNNYPYIEADAFNGNPYAILGSVIEVRKSQGKCPTSLNAPNAVPEFSVSKITGYKIDESSKLKEPIKRQSITVDKKLSAQVSFLSYLNSQLSDDSSFNLLVFDQAAGLVNRDDDSWDDAVQNWQKKNVDIIEDQDICYLFAVIGFVQKYVIRKTYKKFSLGVKGGGLGANINGELFTSTEDYSLDIRYGLTPSIIKRPASLQPSVASSLSLKNNELTDEEKGIFSTILNISTKNILTDDDKD